MTWLRGAPYLLSLLLGGFLGWVFSGWQHSGLRAELADLRADQRIIVSTSAAEQKRLNAAAQQARRYTDDILARLDRARSGREVRYEIKTRIIERIPRDRLCLDADDLRLLSDADRIDAGSFTSTFDPIPPIGDTAPPTASSAGLSAGAAGAWIADARARHDECRNQIGALSEWARAHEGVCGCLSIEGAGK